MGRSSATNRANAWAGGDTSVYGRGRGRFGKGCKFKRKLGMYAAGFLTVLCVLFGFREQPAVPEAIHEKRVLAEAADNEEPQHESYFTGAVAIPEGYQYDFD